MITRSATRPQLTSLLAMLVTVIAPPVTASAQTHQGEAMPNHCLVELRTPSPTSNAMSKYSEWTPVAHSNSGRHWLLEGSSSCNSAMSLANVRRAHPAALLVVTLESGAEIPEKQIEKLGGVITAKLQNLNVITIAVPDTAVTRVAKIPGVLRAQKDLPQTTTRRRK